MGRIAHAIEDNLSQIKRTSTNPAPELFESLINAVRLVNRIVEAIGTEKDGTIKGTEETITALQAHLKKKKKPKQHQPARKPRKIIHVRESAEEQMEKILTEAASKTVEITDTPTFTTDETVRVQTKDLDNLMNLSGEVIIHRFKVNNALNRFKKLLREFNRIYFALNRCNNIAEEPLINDRLEELSEGREILQLLRSMNAGPIRSDLQYLFDEMTRIEMSVNGLSRSLASQVSEVRLITAESVFERFRILVRDYSRRYERQINFIPEGGRLRIDRRILNEMVDILLHLIRNALDHGIEPLHIRKKKKKPEEGNIYLKLRRVGSRLEVVLEDDGAGLNVPLIRKEAARRGLYSRSEIRNMDDQEVIYRTIMEPGFSTARKVTSISGRGFGLDAVKARVEKLKGDFEIRTEKDKYTRFVIEVPLSVSTLHGLVVISSGQRFVIPMNLVVETMLIPRSDLYRREARRYIRRRKKFVPHMHLADILGFPKTSSREGKIKVVIVSYRHRHFAIGVDDFVGAREVVVKSLGNHLTKVQCVSGCTVFGDGEPILILEVPEIIRKAYSVKVTTAAAEIETKEEYPVLVVDDSATSRLLEKGILEGEGFKVHVASNGEEALLQIRREKYSVMVFDIDMPGMSGIELVEETRETGINKNTPIIMVSSRDDEDTIYRCFEAGARGYIVKNRFKQHQFVDMVKSYTS